MTLFSDRLKALREERNWTQEQLAERANLKLRAIQYYEGEEGKPNFANLEKLAGALETTTDFLSGKTDDPKLPITNLSSREARIIDKFRRGEYGALIDEIIDEAAQHKSQQPPPSKGKTALNR